MQCFNCGFENIPGSQLCVRCRSSLGLGDVAVVPPRAPRYRWGTRLRQAWNGAASAADDWWQARPRWQPASLVGVPWEALAWSIVPGLGHVKHGHKRAGRLLLAAWSAMVLLSVVSIGTDWHPWCITGAVGIHAFAILSLLRPELDSQATMVSAAFGLVLFLGLRWVIYGSIGWLAGQFFAPFLVAGMLPGNLIQDGDAVLHEGSWTRPETFHRGDLVVYRVGGSRYAQPGYVVPEGFGLDRVVGVPGDDVQLKEGRLLVNGQPPGPEQMPLGKVSPLVDFAFRVENGQYAIVPSRLDLAIHGTVQAAPILQQIALVSDNDVLGRVVLRLRPWSRFGRIQ